MKKLRLLCRVRPSIHAIRSEMMSAIIQIRLTGRRLRARLVSDVRTVLIPVQRP